MLIFRALHSQNYRLFFAGQAFSNLGNMMKQVAIGWLVYRLTDSALLLGVVSFSREISAFLFSTLAGVMADRYNKHRLLMLCQGAVSLNAAILAWLTLSDQISVALLILLQILFGLISGLEMPSRHAFVNDLVEDKTYLTNAIALNSSLFNTARILGPALAGLLIPLIGEGYCFLLYAVMSFAVVLIFLFIRYSPSSKSRKNRNFMEEFKEGARYSLRTKHIRLILLLVSGITLLGVSYMVVLPVFAADVFQADAVVFGYMTSAVGLGSLLGAIFVGAKNNALGLDKWILIGTVIFGLALGVFAFSPYLWLSLAALVATGLGRVIIFTGSNTLLQTIAPEEKRGRVLSFYIMLFMGALSLGSFIIGWITDLVGGPATLAGGSIGVLMMAIYYSRNLLSFRKSTYKAMRQSGAA